MTEPLGTITEDDAGGWVLRYERDLAHPREKVWRALTESEHLRSWLPCDIVGERRAGARIELPFWPEVVEHYHGETPTLDGEILAFDPPSRFEWVWDTERIRFDLAETPEGTRLTLTTWVGDGPEPVQNVASGYHVCLDHLVRLLDEGRAPCVVETDPTPLQEAYLARLAGSAG